MPASSYSNGAPDASSSCSRDRSAHSRHRPTTTEHVTCAVGTGINYLRPSLAISMPSAGNETDNLLSSLGTSASLNSDSGRSRNARTRKRSASLGECS